VPTVARSPQPLPETAADTVAVFATKNDQGAVLGSDAAGMEAALGIDLRAELAAVRFDGALGTVARVPTRGGAKAPILLVVGLTPADHATTEPVALDTLRKAAGTAARNATRHSTLALAAPLDLLAEDVAPADAVAAVVEGAGLGAYAFTRHRSKSPDAPALDAVLILAEGADEPQIERGLTLGEMAVRATCLARDLVNTPPSMKRPPALAEQIAGIAREAGLEARILDEAALADGGFGGILGVGQGSSVPPRLVELTYTPEGSEGHVVLAGKGITFDSGGISLKPSASMAAMKCDMSGAAAVLAAMTGLPQLGGKTKVTGLLPLAENMPSGTAIRVSDVLTHRGGQTVEVMNTDAEGRLVLADALAYGAEMRPDAMVDIATLTGAQIVALGPRITGIMGTDEQLVEALQSAGAEAGEPSWRLPLPAEYRDQLKSEVADLKNIGRRGEAGTVVAALFLKEFTADLPWAHLDIAGPAWTDEGDGHYLSKGGTGAGVGTLLRYLASLG